MFQSTRNITLPFCFRRKQLTCSLVLYVSLVECLELCNAKKGNLLEFVHSFTDGNCALLFLVSKYSLNKVHSVLHILQNPLSRIVCTSENSLLEISQWNCSWYSYFWLIFFSQRCLLSMENSGGYSKVSAKICVNHV